MEAGRYHNHSQLIFPSLPLPTMSCCYNRDQWKLVMVAFFHVLFVSYPMWHSLEWTLFVIQKNLLLIMEWKYPLAFMCGFEQTTELKKV